MRSWLALLVVPALSACAAPDSDTGDGVIVEVEPVWPEAWEYRAFCWYQDEDGCKYNDGEKTPGARVDCVDVADSYGCVTDGLNDLGADGWFLEPTENFPDAHVVYLMTRPG